MLNLRNDAPIAPPAALSFGSTADRGLFMEEIVSYAALGTLGGSGVYVGQRWARSNGHAVLLGLALAVAAVMAVYCLTVVLGVVSPGSLEPRQMGFFLVMLLPLGSILGIVAALSGRRRAVKAAARLF